MLAAMARRARASAARGIGARLACMLALAAALAPASPALAELSLGATGGMVFGGNQQVTVKTYGPDENLDSIVSRERVSVNPGGIGMLTLTYWLHPASPWGVQAEAV